MGKVLAFLVALLLFVWLASNSGGAPGTRSVDALPDKMMLWVGGILVATLLVIMMGATRE
jgi:hypothetical protein